MFARIRFVLFLCIVFFCFTIPATAHNRAIDSMITVLNNSSDPVLNSEICSRIAFTYLSVNTDSSAWYANRGVSIAKENRLDTALAKGLICKTFALEAQGELGDALSAIDSALAIAEQHKKPKTLFSAYNIKAKLLKSKSKYADALTYYLKAMELAEEENSDEMKARSYNNLGVFYLSRKELGMSEEYHKKSLEVRLRLGVNSEIATSYENIGIVNREKKNYEEALRNYFKALELNIIEKDSSSIAYSYNDIGAAYSLKGATSEAEHYLLSSIRIRSSINEKDDLAYTYAYLGENYERKGDKHHAQQYLKTALETAAALSNSKQQLECLERLSRFYERNRQFDSAYRYARLHQEFSDSLRSKDNEELLSQLSAKYETVKKDRVIQQHVFDLTLKNYWIGGLMAALAALLTLGAMAYKYYRQRQYRKLQEAIIMQQDLAAGAVLEAEENERKRIAADLHDGIGQMLTAVRMNLEALQEGDAAVGDSRKDIMKNVLQLVEESCKEVRTVSHSIMPNALIKSGLAHALKDFVEKIENPSLAIHLNTYGLHESLEPKTEIVVYRIIQESVNNVIRHARASRLDISIINDAEGLQVSIEDNGTGFNKAKLEQGSGIGMKNIRARVEFLHGTLDIDSKPGKGTLIAIFIPNR